MQRLFKIFTARRVWNQYFPAVDSVVFVVDAADRKVMSKVVYELDVSTIIILHVCLLI